MITGIDVFGAAAAATQLFETTFNLVAGIAELRDRMKDAPAQIQSFRDELDSLTDTIVRIGNNPRLQTPHLELIITAVGLKVDTLNSLLSKLSTGSNLPSVKRLVRVLKLKQTEARILQNFADLERDKTSLILTVNELLPKIINDTFESNRAMANNSDQSTCNNTGGESSNQQRQLHLNNPQLLKNDQLTPPETPRISPTLSYPPAMSQSQPANVTAGRSNFSRSQIIGNGNWMGNGNGTPGDFQDARIQGNKNIQGQHGDDSHVARAFSSMISPGQQGGQPSGHDCEGSHTMATSQAERNIHEDRPDGGEDADRFSQQIGTEESS
ncbi:hypothetical protein V8E51_004825 [Hyaloscypha variabilis]